MEREVTSVVQTAASTSVMKKCILVLGMHRSGTSATTGVLSRVGCQLPLHLYEAAKDNPKGFFESKLISKLNNAILESAGTSWDDWQEINQDWYETPVRQEFEEKAITLVGEEFQGSSLIALKDPRICRLVPFWISVLKRAGYDPLVMHVHRSPIEVAQSLQKRDHFEPSLSNLIWLRHVLDAERATRGRQRVFTSYDLLLENWPNQVRRFQEVLDVKFPRISTKAETEVEEFLDPAERHHAESQNAISKVKLPSDWIWDCYRLLEKWAKEGEDVSDYSKLDETLAELKRATPAFARLIQAGRAAEKKARLLVDAKATLTELQSIVRDLKTEIEMRDHKILNASENLDAMTNELDTNSKELSDITRENARLKQDIEKQSSQSQAQKREYETKTDEIQKALRNRHQELSRLAVLHIKAQDELEKQRTSARMARNAARADILAAMENIGSRYNYLGYFTFVKDRKLIQCSELFDPNWYLEEYSDVKNAEIDPAKHYLLFGCGEGRDPSRAFQSTTYYQSNRDVLAARMNALVHYLRYGQFEGRS